MVRIVKRRRISPEQWISGQLVHWHESPILIDSKYDLNHRDIFFSEIRWINEGKMLKRLYEFQNEIKRLME